MKALLLLIAICIFLVNLNAADAQPAIIYVSKCNEASFNAALYSAADQSTIKLKCDGNIRLTSIKKITQNISIDGSGHKIILDGQRKTGIFEIPAGKSLSLESLTFINADALFDENYTTLPNYRGSAIVNYGELHVTRCSFYRNFSGYPYTGGAVDNHGTLTVNDSYFSKNGTRRGPGPRAATAGGAIANAGTASIHNTAFYDNESGSGGAIYNGSNIEIYQSVFANNHAATYECLACGGAVDNRGMMRLENSTIYANESFGIINRGTAIFISSTIFHNEAYRLSDSEPIYYRNILNLGVLTLRNSIIAAISSTFLEPGAASSINRDYRNCETFSGFESGIIDGGYNLQYPDQSCGSTISVADPMLTAWSDYGGVVSQGAEGYEVRMLGLSEYSPAINKGSCLQSPYQETDGRGFSRATDGRCDIGAFEYGAITSELLPTPTRAPTYTPYPTPIMTVQPVKAIR
jgi:hypothetical protein